jgi:REP-associated tyrosine transposase
MYAIQMGRAKQIELPLPKRGGRREGAGRPRTRPHPGLVGPGVPHLPRPDFAARCPLHITQRMQPGIGHLRTQSRLQLIREALHAASDGFGMRVVHFSVQGNHLHLIVEADGREALSKSMKGLAVRVAVGLNRLAGRRGTVFADRYHARALETPREVANTLRYVLENYRKHARETLAWSWRDPFASSLDKPLREPRLWLLRVGWTRAPVPSRLSGIDAFLRDDPTRHLCS